MYWLSITVTHMVSIHTDARAGRHFTSLRLYIFAILTGFLHIGSAESESRASGAFRFEPYVDCVSGHIVTETTESIFFEQSEIGQLKPTPGYLYRYDIHFASNSFVYLHSASAGTRLFSSQLILPHLSNHVWASHHSTFWLDYTSGGRYRGTIGAWGHALYSKGFAAQIPEGILWNLAAAARFPGAKYQVASERPSCGEPGEWYLIEVDPFGAQLYFRIVHDGELIHIAEIVLTYAKWKGMVKRFLLSRYQVVDGIPYPFHIVAERRFDGGSTLNYRKVYLVKEAQFNIAPLDVYELMDGFPRGTPVFDRFTFGKAVWTEGKVLRFNWDPVNLARQGIRDLGFPVVPFHHEE